MDGHQPVNVSMWTLAKTCDNKPIPATVTSSSPVTMKPSATLVDDFIAPPCYGEIRILYQDDEILLIDKPSGLLSLSGKNPLNKDSVHYRLVSGQLKGFADKPVQAEAQPPAINNAAAAENTAAESKAPAATQQQQAFPSAQLIHRLDFGTSGIMVVALNKQAIRVLSKQFELRTVSKSYIAILDGSPIDDQGVIDHPIAKGSFPLQKICQETGKTARSEYQVLERFNQPDRCRVRFTPHTGRTHQLRIHSREMGHPILGCDLYKNERSEGMAERLLLHANELHIDHPSSGQRMLGNSPCPF